MTRPAKGDQVFQLSLSEIAFTVAFLLLMLLGAMVFRAEEARKALGGADPVARADAAAASAARDAQAAQAARASLKAALAGAGATDPDAMVTKLVDAENAKAREAVLRARIEDLDAQLSALAAVKPTAGASGGGSDTGRGIGPGTGTGMNAALADASPLSPDQLRQQNADLRGQVQFYKNRLGDAHGGLDYPPCWADANGKVQLLLAIQLTPEGAAITRAWPDARAADARALPDVAGLVGTTVPYAAFGARVQGLAAWARQQHPECRHYVALRSTLADAVQSDRARLLVENWFYKVEVRR